MENEDYLGMGIVLIIILALVFGGVFALRRTQCLSKYSNYDAHYGIFSGCRIDWNGKITPVDIIREIN